MELIRDALSATLTCQIALALQRNPSTICHADTRMYVLSCVASDRPRFSPGEKYRGLLFSQFIAQISHANRDSLGQSLNYRSYLRCRRRSSEKRTIVRAFQANLISARLFPCRSSIDIAFPFECVH